MISKNQDIHHDSVFWVNQGKRDIDRVRAVVMVATIHRLVAMVVRVKVDRKGVEMWKHEVGVVNEVVRFGYEISSCAMVMVEAAMSCQPRSAKI